jgi:hypothetical protein
MFYSFIHQKSFLKSLEVLLKCSFVLLFTSLGFVESSNAQGNLLVTPKRVVFEGNKRSEELNLANVGRDSATFVVSFIQIKMHADGTFEQITQPDSAQKFADKNIRFFPRTVTLGPNEAQTVKVQLFKASELTPGEYRSHLYFRSMPVEKPLGERPPQKDSSISVHLVPIFGISIPVIIRVGENSSKVNLSNITFHMERDTLPTVNMTLNRSGSMSVYGDISVDHISPQGKVTPVGVVKGFAIYTPNALRTFQLALNKASNINYHKGKLHITYTDQSLRALKLAEEEIALN